MFTFNGGLRLWICPGPSLATVPVGSRFVLFSRAFQHVLQHQHISPTRQHSSPTHLDVSQGRSSRSKKFEAASPASHFGTPFQLPTFLERKRRQGNKIHQLYFVSFSPAETGKVLNTAHKSTGKGRELFCWSKSLRV